MDPHHRRVAAGIGWGRAIVLALLAGPPFMLVGTSGFQFAPLAPFAPDPLLPELRTALATGRTARIGLTVHYQAVVSLTDGAVGGAGPVD